MSFSDFRDIVDGGDTGKPERLFRAAVSAYCALTRPSRRETAQLDALCVPLYDSVSLDGRRFVAAALSECAAAPPRLLERLCDETVDVCAPLLIRSPSLADVTLIDLVGRHGLPHARAIARRPGLNPTIMQLIRALEAAVAAEKSRVQAAAAPPALAPASARTATAAPGARAEATRKRLRELMARDTPDAAIDLPVTPETFDEIREAALSADEARFVSALGTSLRLSPAGMLKLLETAGLTTLLVALRGLDFAEEQAFLVGVIVYPENFESPADVRLFLERYRAMDRRMALDRIHGWKIEIVADWVREHTASFRARGFAS